MNCSRVPAAGMKYFDCDGRSGRSGNRTEPPGSSPSTSLVPSPAVMTRTSDVNRPGGRGRAPGPADRVMACGQVFSATVTPRARRPSRSTLVTAARSANPASTSSHPPSASNCGNRCASWARENLAAQLQLLQHRVALHRVGLVQVGRDAVLDQVEAAAVDQQPLAGLPLQLPPQLPRLDGQPGVGRVPVVVAHRPGQAERRGRRIAHPGPLQHGHGVGQRRGVVRRHESHDSAADDRQPPGHRHAPSLLAAAIVRHTQQVTAKVPSRGPGSVQVRAAGRSLGWRYAASGR